MLTRITLLIILLIFSLAACNQQPTPPPEPTPTPDPLLADTAPKPVDLTASDGVTLKALYYPPKNPNLRSPALLLLPMLNSGKEVWQEFAVAAQEAGHAVLALDLRGQGESGGAQDFGVMDQDIDVALNWPAGRRLPGSGSGWPEPILEPTWRSGPAAAIQK